MPGAARQRQRTPLHFLHRLVQYLLQSAFAGGSGNPVKLFGAEPQLATRSNGLRLIQQRIQQRIQRLVFRPANVEGQRDFAGNDVNRAGRAAQRTHRGDPVSALLAGQRLYPHHPFGGGGQRIFPMTHRYGPGVSRLAGKAAVQTTRAVNRFHYA